MSLRFFSLDFSLQKAINELSEEEKEDLFIFLLKKLGMAKATIAFSKAILELENEKEEQEEHDLSSENEKEHDLSSEEEKDTEYDVTKKLNSSLADIDEDDLSSDEKRFCAGCNEENERDLCWDCEPFRKRIKEGLDKQMDIYNAKTIQIKSELKSNLNSQNQ